MDSIPAEWDWSIITIIISHLLIQNHTMQQISI